MNFEMTGKLSISKESDKFKPYEEKTYPSGWKRKTLLFNATCGDNRHMLSVQAGAFSDGHGDIYSFTKSTVDENGNRVKGQSIQIPFKDRLTSPKIEWDFVDFIKKVIESDKYKDSLFCIKGNGEYSYSDKNQRFYESYVPTRIYLAAPNAEQSSTATLNIIFNHESLDDMSADEKHKYYVNGYMMQYDNNRKENLPVPVTIAIPIGDDEKSQKWAERVKHKFMFEDDDESFKEYGVIVNMLNGAQRVEITEDMLTDEQKEDIEFGLITLDDIRKDLGGGAYGDRIREYQFVKPARGFMKGREDTVYKEEDMIVKPLVSDDEEAEDVDLFDEEVVEDDDEL